MNDSANLLNRCHLAVLAIVSIPGLSFGTPVVTEENNPGAGAPNETIYSTDVSSTDLLQGLIGIESGAPWQSAGSSARLNNGNHGPSFEEDQDGSLAEIAWANPGSIVTYTLGTGANGLGYDIESIQSIAAWQSAGFGNQGYTIEVQPVGGAFVELVSIDYSPLGEAAGATKVLIEDDGNGPGGNLANGIEAIRFTHNSVAVSANGRVTYRELDVFGTDTVVIIPDQTPPTLSLTSPANTEDGVDPTSDLVATFSEAIAFGSGSITLRNLDALTEVVIPVSDSRLSVNGTNLIISPSTDLEPNTDYAVLIDTTAIEDTSGNAFVGISDEITWSFRTATPSSLVIAMEISGPNDPSQFDDENAFSGDVSNEDLLHGIIGTGGSWNAGNASPEGLNDGLGGGDFDAEGLTALQNSAWASDGDGVSFREFELGGAFDIAMIQSIAGWQGAGFANQKYEVRFRLTGEAQFPVDPSFVVDYQPFSTSLTEGGSTKVTITSSNGLLASGVEAIRFDVLDTISNEAGGTVFHEIDVFGPGGGSESGLVLGITQNEDELSFRWNSQAGVRYDLVSSTGLDSPVTSWEIYDEDGPGGVAPYEDILAAGAETVLNNVKRDGTTRFFAIVQRP